MASVSKLLLSYRVYMIYSLTWHSVKHLSLLSFIKFCKLFPKIQQFAILQGADMWLEFTPETSLAAFWQACWRSGSFSTKCVGRMALREISGLTTDTASSLQACARTWVTLCSCAESQSPWLQVKAITHPPSLRIVNLMLNNGPRFRTQALPCIVWRFRSSQSSPIN